MRTVLICALLFSASTASVAAASPTSSCGAALQPGTAQVSMSAGGHIREFTMFIPKAYDGRRRVPLVFDLHGSGGDGRRQASNSDFARTAEQHGFLVAWPNGGVTLPGNRSAHYWNITGVPLVGGTPVPADAPDDVQFFRDAIEQLTSRYCIDARRIYAAGFSGGARMSSLLACAMADRIAAVAPVAGLRAGLPDQGDRSRPDGESCRPARAIPVITFHGTHDGTNPYAGGDNLRWRYGVESAVDQWVALNGCREEPVVEQVSTDVERRRYLGCRNNAVVEFNRIDLPESLGGGHVWPRGAATRIWEFFAQYSLE